MAEAESRSITRRAVVAGSAGVIASLPEAAVARMSEAICRGADPGCRFAHPGYETDTDPIYRAIAQHACAYAAYDAQQKAEPGDEETLEPLIEAEWAAAAALAATVPATLAGAAAALDHVRLLRERDNYMLLDDWHCYVFIGSAATALRNVLDRSLA